MRIIVVGAGVVGLSCAVRLLEAGHRVDVVARDLPQETTSAVAAAIWYPYRALPQDRVTAWAAASYAVFAALAAPEEYGGSPEVGVRMVPGTELFTSAQPDPWWSAAVPRLDRVRDLPAGYADGWSFTAPVIEMPVYLTWLTARLEELGGTLTRLNLRALPAGADLVVNCSGLGARLLGEDRSVVPVRGQVVYVEQVGVDRWWLDPAGPTYVVPRGREIVVGGTDQEGEWSRTPSPETAAEILQRAIAAGSRAAGRPGAPAQGRAAAGAPGRPARARGARRALLRARRRRRDAQLGVRGGRRGPGRAGGLVLDVRVEPVPNPRHGRRGGVDEALLGQGAAAGRRRVPAPPGARPVRRVAMWKIRIRRAGARSRRCRAARRSRRSRRRSRGRWRAPGPAA